MAPQPTPPYFKGTGQASKSGLPSQLRKTKLCLFSLKGVCQFGDSCTFAHSEDELQGTPDLKKTKLCAKFMEAEGCDNDDCPFAHGCEELRSTNMFYKKTLCIWNERGGKCRNGAACHFAHGLHELRGADSSSAGQSTKQPSTNSGRTTPEDHQNLTEPKPLRVAPPSLTRLQGSCSGKPGRSKGEGKGGCGPDLRRPNGGGHPPPPAAEPMKIVPHRMLSGTKALPSWSSRESQEFAGACPEQNTALTNSGELKAELDRLTGMLSALEFVQAKLSGEAATALDQQQKQQQQAFDYDPSTMTMAAMWQWGMDPYMSTAAGLEWQPDSDMAWQQELPSPELDAWTQPASLEADGQFDGPDFSLGAMGRQQGAARIEAAWMG